MAVHRPFPARKAPFLLVITCALSASVVATAGSWVYTSNMEWILAAGYPGVRITLGTKTLTLNGTEYRDVVPCQSTHTDVTWSDSDGTSSGVSKDFNYPTHDDVWASIVEETASSG